MRYLISLIVISLTVIIKETITRCNLMMFNRYSFTGILAWCLLSACLFMLAEYFDDWSKKKEIRRVKHRKVLVRV